MTSSRPGAKPIDDHAEKRSAKFLRLYATKGLITQATPRKMILLSARSFGFQQGRESKPPAPNPCQRYQPDGRRWSVDHLQVISKSRDATAADYLETGECP
jgi:hypothetical protein